MCNKLIALLLISTQAFAGLPPTTIQGQSDSSSKVKSSFQVPHNQATDLGGVKSLIETGSSNILPDPGFEAATSVWTASGGATATTNSTAKGTGALGYDWDSNSASQTLMSTSVTIPNGLQSKNGVASCQIKTVSGTATHTIVVNDGTNDIGTPLTIGSSTTSFQETKINFVFPSSGTIRLKIASVASNEPEIYIDDCKISLADNVYEAPIVGPWESYTPTFTGFGTVTNIECKSRRNAENREIDCKFTTGTPTATEARVSLPNSLTGAGAPLVSSIKVAGYGSENSTGTSPIVGATHSVLVEPSTSYVTFGFRNASQGALTKTTGSSGFTGSAAFSFFASVPISGYSAISAQSADQTDFGWTSFTTTGSWVSNTTYTGKYRRVGEILEGEVLVSLSGAPTSATLTVDIPNSWTIDTSKMNSPSTENPVIGTAQMFDVGTQNYQGRVHYNNTTSVLIRVMGSSGAYVNNTSVTQALPFTFGNTDIVAISYKVPIQGWSSNQRAPTLVGSVTSNAQNAERIERAFITISGGTPSITSQSGSWISSLTDNGVGDISINYSSNTFSSAPTCVCTAVWPGASTGGVCNINTNSTTTTQFKISNDAGAAADYSFYMHCMGPR